MRDAFDRARIRAGVADVTLHDLRAKSATDAEQEGLNPTLLLLHSSPQMTERYIRQQIVPVTQRPRMKLEPAKS
jgi:integrase